MTQVKGFYRRYAAFAERYYSQLMLVVGLVVMLCALSAVVTIRTDHAQDKQRADDQAKVQSCFNRFASSLAGGLPPVRNATAVRDAALGNAMAQLQNTLQKAVTSTVSRRDGVRLVDSLRTYQRAERKLAVARKENPYPAAPAKLCDLIATNDHITPKSVPTPSLGLTSPSAVPRSREARTPSATSAAQQGDGEKPHHRLVHGHHPTTQPGPTTHPHPSPSPSPCLITVMNVCVPQLPGLPALPLPSALPLLPSL